MNISLLNLRLIIALKKPNYRYILRNSLSTSRKNSFNDNFNRGGDNREDRPYFKSTRNSHEGERNFGDRRFGRPPGMPSLLCFA